ncbi:MAG: hypothetical protein CVU39_16240 [Chloroflexi bacterium HGW-Chloroflexi-10]|nr:MAG: hypothetical protein CVU39_16240 [Chloroflexi bacterium HGW-Chloroflexi-10]
MKKSGLCLIWLFLLVGCVSNSFQQNATVIPTQIDFPAITKTSNATIAFTANVTVFPEQSPTPIQTYIERSITPSISLTPTRIGSLTTTPIPASTMSGPEIREFVIEMLHNNGECRLPCFWGLSPQLDTSQTSQAFIKRFGIVTFAKDIITHSNTADATMGNTDIDLYNNGSRTHISISYHNQLGKLEQLVVGAESTYESGEGGDLVNKTNYGDPNFTQLFKYYLLPDILSNYGLAT